MCSKSINWKAVCFQLWKIGFKMGSCLLPERDWSIPLLLSTSPHVPLKGSELSHSYSVLTELLSHLLLTLRHFPCWMHLFVLCLPGCHISWVSLCCVTDAQSSMFKAPFTAFLSSHVPETVVCLPLWPHPTSLPIQVSVLLLSICFTHGFWIFLPKI